MDIVLLLLLLFWQKEKNNSFGESGLPWVVFREKKLLNIYSPCLTFCSMNICQCLWCILVILKGYQPYLLKVLIVSILGFLALQNESNHTEFVTKEA